MANIVHYAQRPAALVKEVWTSGLYARLPQFYRKNYEDWERYKKLNLQSPHEVPPQIKSRWHTDRFGAPKLNSNVPIRIHYPDQCDKGLWGGEGIIEGMIVKEKRWFDAYIPKIWRPSLARRVFYSEILDKHFIITCTSRTLDLVDEANGFDFYVLKTHPVDLRSQLALDLRRDMLLCLARKQTKSDDIQRKFSQFVIPEDEAEWFGLRLEDAIAKQANLEEQQRHASVRPLKDLFREQLIARLKEGTDITQQPLEKAEDSESSSSDERSTFQKLQFWKKRE